jgi:hypothetical protein
MVDLLNKEVSLFFIIFLMSMSLNVTAKTAVFGISGSAVTLKIHPDGNTLTDVNGFYGEVGRKLLIDEMRLSPIMEDGVFGSGKLNLDTGNSSFLVNWKVDFDIFDYDTGELLGTDSFSLSFKEKGNVDLLTDVGTFSGQGQAVPNGDTKTSFFVGNPSLRIKIGKLWIEIITIIKGMKQLEECNDDLVPISFDGGEPKGKEIEIQTRPEGGGEKLFGTLVGKIDATCEDLAVELLNFGVNTVNDSINLTLETGYEQDNLGMNIWCGQLNDNHQYFEKIAKLNNELIPTQSQSVYSSTSYSKENFIDKAVLPPGENFCVVEDINEAGKCTTHCDDIVKVNSNLGDSNLEVAKKLCKDHEYGPSGKMGVCIEKLLSQRK